MKNDIESNCKEIYLQLIKKTNDRVLFVIRLILRDVKHGAKQLIMS